MCDVGNRTIRQIEIASGNVTTIAGTAGLQNITDGVGPAARFIAPGPIWGDGTNLYIADASNLARVIRRLTISSRQVTTIANLSVVPNGSTFLGLWGDGSNLYVADAAAHAIRSVALASNQITTFAGAVLSPGTADGSATSARFNTPSGIWGDGTNLFVGDAMNRTIRQISIATGETTTIAGLAGQPGVSDGIGPAARFQFPAALWGVGTSVYIADYSSSTVRQIDTTTTSVTTVAGSASISGIADGTGTAARFAGPTMLTGDGNNLYIVDSLASTIRKANLATAEVTTIAGSPGVNTSVDGTGSAANFWTPLGITSDAENLYVTEAGADTVRRIQLSTAQTATLAGNAQANSGYVDAVGTAARFNAPFGFGETEPSCGWPTAAISSFGESSSPPARLPRSPASQVSKERRTALDRPPDSTRPRPCGAMAPTFISPMVTQFVGSVSRPRRSRRLQARSRPRVGPMESELPRRSTCRWACGETVQTSMSRIAAIPLSAKSTSARTTLRRSSACRLRPEQEHGHRRRRKT